MANIAVARIKREFKEVVKSEEVCRMSLTIIIMTTADNRILNSRSPTLMAELDSEFNKIRFLLVQS